MRTTVGRSSPRIRLALLAVLATITTAVVFATPSSVSADDPPPVYMWTASAECVDRAFTVTMTNTSPSADLWFLVESGEFKLPSGPFGPGESHVVEGSTLDDNIVKLLVYANGSDDPDNSGNTVVGDGPTTLPYEDCVPDVPLVVEALDGPCDGTEGILRITNPNNEGIGVYLHLSDGFVLVWVPGGETIDYPVSHAEGYGFPVTVTLGSDPFDPLGPFGVPAGCPLPETCNGLEATIVGTDGNDTLYGTDGPDVIVGLDGNDRIYGYEGDDVICAGSGRDRAFGGGGDDIINGGAANDQLFGGFGNDVLRGQVGRDTLRGGNGNDLLDGGSGPDLLIGQGGIDNCIGDDGTDRAKTCEVLVSIP